MTAHNTQLDLQAINTIRFLAVDAVEKAKSGHPGAPMGAAVMAYVLWDRHLKFNPRDPNWPDRDRFILSAGHASMLIYALLHLTGYELSLDDLQHFRQWQSKTPGHPEFGHTPGVEVTTGPLGQGFANGVGMAIAEQWLACNFNRPEQEIIDHYIYALVSDGDLEEGIASEAASLAGTLRLGKLIYLYDSNNISIEGNTDISFCEDVAQRFAAYGWQVVGPIDGMNPEAVDAAIREAQADATRPSIIIGKTIIGYGGPEQGTCKVHGEPLGEANLRTAKTSLDWPTEPSFYVPDEVKQYMRRHIEIGQQAEGAWQRRFQEYATRYPELAQQYQQQSSGQLPEDWTEGLAEIFPPGSKPIATRSASGKVINALARNVPALMGGSADLAPSTKTLMEQEADFAPDCYSGRNLHFGVREHAMGGIANGMARHGGVIPYTATFLIFSDYMRHSLRLAALMGIRVIHVFTHDSIALGEDGPTHQPIEQIMSLREIPNYTLIRPADAAETVMAWCTALRNCHGPTALILTRQNLPLLDRSKYAPAEHLQYGGYILWQSSEGTPDIILIATGSEVGITLQAGEQLAADGAVVRIVALPSWELFDAQPEEYRRKVLPPAVRARVSVEAGNTLGWEHYVGLDGACIGINHFGASAPAEILAQEFGFTPAHIVQAAREVMARLKQG